MNPFDYFLAYEFARWQLLAALVVALLCAVLGVYVVLRGMSMLGDGLAHISFAGIALGLALGFYPLPMAMGLAVLGALLIHALGARRVVRSDTAIGILFSAGLALGVLIVSKNGGVGANAQAYLFGNLASVQREDAWLILALGGLLLAVFAALHKEFLAVTFHEEAARVSGIPTGAFNVAFMALTASGIVVASRIVGVLLVSALLVVPAATALQVARSFRGAIAFSVGFALAGLLAGIYAATAYGTSTGASIALACTGLFTLVLAGKALAHRLARSG